MGRNDLEYHGVGDHPYKACGETGADRENLDGLREQGLMCMQSGVSEDMTEKALSSGRQLILWVGCAVPVSQKGDVALLLGLVRDLVVVSREAHCTGQKPADRETGLSKLELKVKLLSEKAGGANDLQKTFRHQGGCAQAGQNKVVVQIAYFKRNASRKGRLEAELGTAWAEIGQEERVIQDLPERV